MSRLAGLVFLSEKLSERCAAWIPGHKRHVIPNSIAQERIATDDEVAQKQASRPENDVIRLLFVSNMIPSKGFGDLLEAVSLLRRQGVSVRLRMAGRWPSDSAAEEFHLQLESQGLTDVVQHLGVISDVNRLKQLYLWADAFVLPTYYPTEAQPLVLLEALSAGTPVITTRHGGIPEIVSDGVEGYFVTPRSPAEIVAAVETLRKYSVWIERSHAARARFLKAYSPQAVRERWLSLVAHGRVPG